MFPLFSSALRHEEDVVAARRTAAPAAALLRFDLADQTRLATAVSEIVRNAFRYAVDARVQCELDVESRPQRLLIRVQDSGPGISSLDEVLRGRVHSSTGMGLGIAGARRLMDGFTIESFPSGTLIRLWKNLPATAPLACHGRAKQIADAVRLRAASGPIDEVEQQN